MEEKKLSASEILDLPAEERSKHVRQMLADRIAYHEEKLKEELVARDEDVSGFRSFLSLSPEERSEVARRMLRERIEYYDRLEAERAARGDVAASAGQ
jgi:2-phospho-L-lactate guanylyltransferase (CobY/MobA/RfbA family)